MDYRSDLMSAKSKFGNGPECQLRGAGGSSGQAAGDANKGGRSLQPWPRQAVTSAITSGSSYSGSSYGTSAAEAEAVQAQQQQVRVAAAPKASGCRKCRGNSRGCRTNKEHQLARGRLIPMSTHGQGAKLTNKSTRENCSSA